MAKTPCSLGRGSGLTSGQGTRSHMLQLRVHATTKDAAYHNEEGRSCMLQLRPGPAKQINIGEKKRSSSSPWLAKWEQVESGNRRDSEVSAMVR